MHKIYKIVCKFGYISCIFEQTALFAHTCNLQNLQLHAMLFFSFFYFVAQNLSSSFITSCFKVFYPKVIPNFFYQLIATSFSVFFKFEINHWWGLWSEPKRLLNIQFCRNFLNVKNLTVFKNFNHDFLTLYWKIHDIHKNVST